MMRNSLIAISWTATVLVLMASPIQGWGQGEDDDARALSRFGVSGTVADSDQYRSGRERSRSEWARLASGDSREVDLLGKWASGPCYAVAARRDTVFLGNGGYLEVLDFSNPSVPELLGREVLPAMVEGVTLEHDFAYVTTGYEGLEVLDISNPRSPVEVGRCDTPGEALDVGVSGGSAFVADGFGGVRVIEVSDPMNPTEVGFFDTKGYAREVAVSEGFVYVADGFEGLRILRIASPTALTEVGYYDPLGYVRRVSVSGSYAYVTSDWEGLRVIDISNPQRPKEEARVSTGWRVFGVTVSGNRAYVTEEGPCVRVFDISDPRSPVQLGCFPRSAIAYEVAVSGDHAYVVDGDLLQLIDFADPTDPVLLASYDTPGLAIGVAAAGEYALVAEGAEGLYIVDVSVPAQPVAVGHMATSAFLSDVAVSGILAYVADGFGLRIIDISHPVAPVERGKIATPGSSTGVAAGDGYAYVADGCRGLRVIDVSDPTQPVEVGFYDVATNCSDWLDPPFEGYVQAVAVKGSHAYLVGDGFQVIDISDPTAPSRVGFCDSEGWGEDIALSGDYAYIADESALLVVNVSDPAAPFVVGEIQSGDRAWGVSVSGHYAYLADYHNGLRVIDVTDPANPVEAGYYRTGDRAHGVTISRGRVYVADGYDGLYILSFGPAPHAILAEADVSPKVLNLKSEGRWITCRIELPIEYDVTQVDRSSIRLNETITPEPHWNAITDADGNNVPDLMLKFSRTEVAGILGKGERVPLKVSGLVGGQCFEGYDTIRVISNPGASKLDEINTEHLFQFDLVQNFPNPFNPFTTISFTLPERTKVTLAIYDVHGKLVRTLVDEMVGEGRQERVWDGKDPSGSPVGSGVYFCRLTAGDETLTKKMILVK